MDELFATRADGAVVRDGATVRHPLQPWSPAVHALLAHLESVDFTAAPRLVAVEADTEVLTFLPGESGADGWAKVVDEDGLRAAARLLRRYHDAVRTWQPADADALVWADGSTGGGDAGRIVCHGDFGSWNIVWDGIEPVGLLDWEYAHVAPALSDVAYALEYMAPFRSDDEAIRWMRYPSAPDRRRRTAIFAQAYGLTGTDGLVDAVADLQRQGRALVVALAERGEARQVAMVAEGYLAELDERIAWTASHRHLLD
jgi:aminoglycoside phosphotransferase (APT) family kinase protein